MNISVPLEPPVGHQIQVDEEDPNADEANQIDIEGIIHAAQSFNVIIYPVSITMVLACFVTIYVQMSQVVIDQDRSFYQQSDETGTDAQKGGQAVLQAIIVIGIFAVLTFVIVFCVWMRLYKVRN
jgi:hypothetical protein